MAFRTSIAAAVELIVAHPVAMKAGCPVAYVGVWEGFIILGQGQIRGVRRAWMVRDMEIGRKCGGVSSEVV